MITHICDINHEILVHITHILFMTYNNYQYQGKTTTLHKIHYDGIFKNNKNM